MVSEPTCGIDCEETGCCFECFPGCRPRHQEYARLDPKHVDTCKSCQVAAVISSAPKPQNPMLSVERE